MMLVDFDDFDDAFAAQLILSKILKGMGSHEGRIEEGALRSNSTGLLEKVPYGRG